MNVFNTKGYYYTIVNKDISQITVQVRAKICGVDIDVVVSVSVNCLCNWSIISLTSPLLHVLFVCVILLVKIGSYWVRLKTWTVSKSTF